MMQITVENGMAKVFTPYNTDFVSKIKNIGGRRWDSVERCWMVPETEIGTVREYMQAVFGETDLPDDSEKVTVKVMFNRDTYEYRSGITLFGKEIARAFGRDSGARVGDDVTLISGRVKSGGSMKNWTTDIDHDTVMKIRNVSKAALDLPTNYDVTVEVIEDAEIDRKALEEEKAKLLARLAEIEKLLA